MKLFTAMLLISGVMAHAQVDKRVDNLYAAVDKLEKLVGAMDDHAVTAQELVGYITEAESSEKGIVKCVLDMETVESVRLDSILALKDTNKKIALLEKWKQDGNLYLAKIKDKTDSIISAAHALQEEITLGLTNWDDPYYVGVDYVFVGKRDLSEIHAVLDEISAQHEIIVNDKKGSKTKKQ